MNATVRAVLIAAAGGVVSSLILRWLDNRP